MAASPPGGLRTNVLAGLTTAAVVIPKSMAYARSPACRSRPGSTPRSFRSSSTRWPARRGRLSVTTTSTLAILAAGAVARAAPRGDGAELVVLAVGAHADGRRRALLAAAVLRFGFLADFISAPVLTGFKAGIAIVIVVDQIPKLLGIHVAKGTFLQSLVGIVQHVPDTSGVTLALGVALLALIVGLERFLPHVAGAAGRGGGGDRGIGVPCSRAARRRAGRTDQAGTAAARPAGRAPRRHALAGGAGHRAHELRRDDRRGPGVRACRRAAADPEPGAPGHRAGQRRGQRLPQHAVGRRHVADGGQPRRGSAYRRRRAW